MHEEAEQLLWAIYSIHTREEQQSCLLVEGPQAKLHPLGREGQDGDNLVCLDQVLEDTTSPRKYTLLVPVCGVRLSRPRLLPLPLLAGGALELWVAAVRVARTAGQQTHQAGVKRQNFRSRLLGPVDGEGRRLSVHGGSVAGGGGLSRVVKAVLGIALCHLEGVFVDVAESQGVPSQRRAHAVRVVDQMLHDEVCVLLYLLIWRERSGGNRIGGRGGEGGKEEGGEEGGVEGTGEVGGEEERGGEGGKEEGGEEGGGEGKRKRGRRGGEEKERRGGGREREGGGGEGEGEEGGGRGKVLAILKAESALLTLHPHCRLQEFQTLPPTSRIPFQTCREAGAMDHDSCASGRVVRI